MGLVFKAKQPKSLKDLFIPVITRGINNALTKAGKILVERIKTVFDLQGERDGHDRWEDIKFSSFRNRKTAKGFTFAKAVAEFQNAIILVDTGSLRDSIDFQIIDNSGVKTLAIQSDVFYDIFHEEGTKNIPQREFLFLTEDDLIIIEMLIRRNISGLR